MNTDLVIQVQKDVLIKKLEANRTTHEREYRKALGNWKKVLRRELSAMLAIVNKDDSGGLKIKSSDVQYIKNHKPVHYLKDYDEALDMLKFGDNTVIELNREQYQAYVKDNWNWKQSFTTSNTAYAASARRR